VRHPEVDDVVLLPPPPAQTLAVDLRSFAEAIGVVLLLPLFMIALPFSLAWRAILAFTGWPAITPGRRHRPASALA